jgi:Peptidase A4 family
VKILPNNLNEWPAGRPYRDADPGPVQTPGRFVSRLVVLVLLGGLIGFGAFHWGLVPDAVLAPLPPAVTAPAQVEPSTVAPPDDTAASTPADDTAPGLDVSGLLGNQAQSQNWAGYAATEGNYTGVSGTWTLPDAASGSPAGMDAAWIGIGGMRSRDLIQAGTQRTVQGGRTQHEAWIELLPKAPETVPLTVRAGDTVRVSIGQQGPDVWLIALTNVSSGQTYQSTRRYVSSGSSVEWIEEAASAGRRNRTLPLDDFGTVRFSEASAVRETQVLTVAQSGAHAITMITPIGFPLAEPSRLNADGASFSVTRTSTPSPRPGR